MRTPTVSVVLPIHAGANPEHLAQALASIGTQTRMPDELVVVEDGGLTAEQHTVIADFAMATTELRTVTVPLPVASGVGRALQAGVEAASSEWIARMDSDDISLPDRLEAELNVIDGEEIDVVGTAVVEFRTDGPGPSTALRRMPETHDEIARYMKRANPMNHPTVVFRRELALSVGGYRDIPHLEDYDLWARMLARGARFANLHDAKLRFRADDAMFDRRRGRGMWRAELALQRTLVDCGLIGRPRMIANLFLRSAFRGLPKPLMRAAYRRLYHMRGPGG